MLSIASPTAVSAEDPITVVAEIGVLARHPDASTNLQPLLRDMLKRLPRPHFSPAVEHQSKPAGTCRLVARRNIEAGEVLVIERGPRVNGRLARMIHAITGHEATCCVGWGEYLLHAPSRDDGGGGYINHSCDPNAGMLAHATWCAIRPILTNEEVTCDYGTFESARDWKMACACGTTECRGVVTGRDFMIPSLQERLGNWFAPYLRDHLNRTAPDCHGPQT
jgi:hypothetical protein